MSTPVLVIHTREKCPGCISLKKPENMERLRSAMRSADPHMELRMITHKFDRNGVTFVDTDKYPTLSPPVFPFFLMMPKSEANPNGDLRKVLAYNAEIKFKNGQPEVIRQGNGYSIEGIANWIATSVRTIRGGADSSAAASSSSSRVPTNLPPPSRPRERRERRHESRFRHGRGLVEQDKRCKRFTLVNVNPYN